MHRDSPNLSQLCDLIQLKVTLERYMQGQMRLLQTTDGPSIRKHTADKLAAASTHQITPGMHACIAVSHADTDAMQVSQCKCPMVQLTLQRTAARSCCWPQSCTPQCRPHQTRPSGMRLHGGWGRATIRVGSIQCVHLFPRAMKEGEW